MPIFLTPPDDELGIGIPVYFVILEGYSNLFILFLCTGPSARRLPTLFTFRLCQIDYVLVITHISYVYVIDSAYF
jgi:hypothetical protein